uniref:Zn(2)-C6 fungal-type domain-containing protein n=1 Tax=Bionectria ochroleuca TaxID=29856 RepID=A0A8H7NHF9_BIOOC
MADAAVRACVRCHRKKVKCTGFPNCLKCNEASVQCELYTRLRKADTIRALREAERRVEWLEKELSREVGMDWKSLPTGTSTQRSPRQSNGVPPECALEPSTFNAPSGSVNRNLEDHIVSPTESQHLAGVDVNSPARSDAPDISLLALNATGEQRYLGPSSGAFFASYATALFQSCEPAMASVIRSGRVGRVNQAQGRFADGQLPLQPDVITLLQKSYEMWVLPLYPLLSHAALDSLANRCGRLQNAPFSELMQSPESCSEMAVFYLVMALGATNHVSTCKQLGSNQGRRYLQEASISVPSSTQLYSVALQYFSTLGKEFHSSPTSIQILLLVCIYSSYGPIESSQWQMAGLAMRTAIEIGLHNKPKQLDVFEEEMDWKNRIFWTAYSIEISLCYNLGRPPSISEEHITADLPLYSTQTAFAIQHITHRQIQSRIISKVYASASNIPGQTVQSQQDQVAKLQSELDNWRVSMTALCSKSPESAYPFSYWDRLYYGTSFVLHRRSPLCPNPSTTSLERCIRSSAAYIDNVLDFLRTSNVPLSWMLVQGVLFAGLTMAVTAQTSYSQISSTSGHSLLLVDFPAWTRKCSVCLAIMNERWDDDLLFKIDAQFEVLADSIQRTISTGLAFRTTGRYEATHSLGESDMNDDSQPAGSLPFSSSFFDLGMTDHWETMDPFGQLLGISGSQSFWDIFPQDLRNNENVQGWDQNLGGS